jgi:hypothetical protein
MNLHPFLRLCAHPGVLSCCTSCALQPAAVVQHPCSKSFLILHHPLRPPKKPMQGKIKGSGTTVRAKPCLHMVWRGTRWPWRGAVNGAAGQRSDAWDRQP